MFVSGTSRSTEEALVSFQNTCRRITRQLSIAICDSSSYNHHHRKKDHRERLTQPSITLECKSESHSPPFAKTTSKLALNPDPKTLSAATPRHPVLLSPTLPLPRIMISPPFLGFCPISGAARSTAASKIESADAESKTTRSASSAGCSTRLPDWRPADSEDQGLVPPTRPSSHAQ